MIVKPKWWRKRWGYRILTWKISYAPSKTRKLLTAAALTALMAQIEEHDRTHIKAKDQLLSD
jgi:hypothetical protein